MMDIGTPGNLIECMTCCDSQSEQRNIRWLLSVQYKCRHNLEYNLCQIWNLIILIFSINLKIADSRTTFIMLK